MEVLVSQVVEVLAVLSHAHGGARESGGGGARCAQSAMFFLRVLLWRPSDGGGGSLMKTSSSKKRIAGVPTPRCSPRHTHHMFDEMFHRSSSLLLAVAAAAVFCTFAPLPATAEPYLCPWRTVAHPEDPFIQNLGSWAVDQQHTVMHFEKVESAKAQGVGQCTSMTRNYELIIDASIRGTPGDGDDYKYRAVVYVINFTQPQKVISFGAIPPSHRPPAAN